MKVVLSKLACDLTITHDSIESAAREAIRILYNRTTSHAGLIMIDPKGNLGCAFNTPRMSRAWVDNSGDIQARIYPGN